MLVWVYGERHAKESNRSIDPIDISLNIERACTSPFHAPIWYTHTHSIEIFNQNRIVSKCRGSKMRLDCCADSIFYALEYYTVYIYVPLYRMYVHKER